MYYAVKGSLGSSSPAVSGVYLFTKHGQSTGRVVVATDSLNG